MDKNSKKQLAIALFLGIGTLALTATTASAKLAILGVAELAKLSATALITIIPQLPVKKATAVLLSVPIYILRRLYRLAGFALRQTIAKIYTKRTHRQIEDDIKNENDPPNDNTGTSSPVNVEVLPLSFIARVFHILGISSVALGIFSLGVSHYVHRTRQVISLISQGVAISPQQVATAVGSAETIEDLINKYLPNQQDLPEPEQELEDLEELKAEINKIENEEGGGGEDEDLNVVVNNSPPDEPPQPPQGGIGRAIRMNVADVGERTLRVAIAEGRLTLDQLSREELQNLLNRAIIEQQQFNDELEERGEVVVPIPQPAIPALVPIPEPAILEPAIPAELILEPEPEEKFIGRQEFDEIKQNLLRIRNELIDADLEQRLDALREGQEQIENIVFVPEIEEEVENFIEDYDIFRQQIIQALNHIEDLEPTEELKDEEVQVNFDEQAPQTQPAVYRERMSRNNQRLEMDYQERLVSMNGRQQRNRKRLLFVFNRGSEMKFIVPSSFNIFNDPLLNLDLRTILFEQMEIMREFQNYFNIGSRKLKKEAMKQRIFDELVEHITLQLSLRHSQINEFGQQNIESARSFFRALIEDLNNLLIKIIRESMMSEKLNLTQIKNIMKLTDSERIKLFKIRNRQEVANASTRGIRELRRLLACRDNDGNLIGAEQNFADAVGNVAGAVGGALLIRSSLGHSRQLLSDECSGVDYYETSYDIEFNEDYDRNYEIQGNFITDPLRGQPAFIGERNFVNSQGDLLYEIQYDEGDFNSKMIFFMGGQIVDNSINGVVKALPSTTHLAYENIHFMRDYSREWLEAIRTAFPNYNLPFFELRNRLSFDVKEKVLKVLRERENEVIIGGSPYLISFNAFQFIFQNSIKKTIKDTILNTTNFSYNDETKILKNLNSIIIPTLQRPDKKSTFENFLDIIRILP